MYKGLPAEAGRCSAVFFADMLHSLCKRRWTGGVEVMVDSKVSKTIFFTRGEISCCSSSLVEDRLGEVVYRKGLISLSKIVKSSLHSKNSDEIKFGQSLVINKSFSATSLWSSLQVQVVETLKSVFYSEQIEYRMDSSLVAFNKISFLFSSEKLIRFVNANGEVYRKVSNVLDQEIKLSVNESSLESAQQGSFVYNFAQNVQGAKNSLKYIEQSHSPAMYAKAELIEGLQRSIIAFGYSWLGNKSAELRKFSDISSIVVDYTNLVSSVFPVFNELSIDFPIDEMNDLVRESNLFGMSWLSLTANGKFSDFSKFCLAVVLECDPSFEEYFYRRVSCLHDFLVQTIRDRLPEKVNKRLKIAS